MWHRAPVPRKPPYPFAIAHSLAVASFVLASFATGARAEPTPKATAAPTPKATTAPAAAAPAAKATKPLEIPFEKLTLDNGLDACILHRDPSLPLVAVNLWYHVGPVERAARAHRLRAPVRAPDVRGLAPRRARVRHAARSRSAPPTSTAPPAGIAPTTSRPCPREQLELVLWLESDRMGYLLDALDQERLDVQRDVVKNERRQSYENAPYGPSTLALLDALFPAGHPYHGAVIGSMADLRAATLDDVKRVLPDLLRPEQRHPRASPATSTRTRRKHARSTSTSARFPKRPPTRRREPADAAAREAHPADGERAGASSPRVALRLDHAAGLHAGRRRARRDDGACSPAASATRLYQELVVKEKVASEVDAELDSNALASMTTVSAHRRHRQDARGARARARSRARRRSPAKGRRPPSSTAPSAASASRC